MKFCTAAEMRLLDSKTINECGIPGVVLMENAGRGASELTRRHFGDLAGKYVAIVCGRGNNGGDGFVMGRIFHGWGAHVRFFLLSTMDRVGGDAKINLDAALKMGLEVVEISDESHLEQLDFGGADIIMDAVLGTGLSSEVRGLYRAAIEKINASKASVVAVDIPSGVDSDTGKIWGAAVKADLTTTFGLPKIGLLTAPGEDLAGRLEVVDIGIPPHVLAEADPGRELITPQTLKGLLKPRSADGHKGRYGHVLVVAGSTGKTGAASLAAEAAARTGAGLVTLAVPESLNSILEVKVTEAMTEPLPEDEAGYLSPAAEKRILELCEGKTVLSLGPGIGDRPATAALINSLVQKSDLPLVIDADGLNALNGDPGILKKCKRGAVITPHPGEAARLLAVDSAAIQADRLAAVSGLVEKTGAISVLKGRHTLIAAPSGSMFMNTTGGPYMASGGMGDLLTGMIAGLIAQGLTLADAARLGVFTHGLAADEASADAPMGMLASDLLDWLPELWARFID